MNIKFSILHSRVGKSECICIRRKLRRLKKGSDYFSVLNKDQGVIHDICQKSSETAVFEPKNYAKKRDFATFANSQQYCVNGFKPMKSTCFSYFTVDSNICTQKAHKFVAALSIKLIPFSQLLFWGQVVVEEKLYMEMVELQKPIDNSRAIVEEEVGAGGPQTREQLVGGLEWCNLQSCILCLCICICICAFTQLYFSVFVVNMRK